MRTLRLPFIPATFHDNLGYVISFVLNQMGALSDDDLVGVKREPCKENFLLVASAMKKLGLHLTKKDVEAITSEVVIMIRYQFPFVTYFVIPATRSGGEAGDIPEEAARAAAGPRRPRRSISVPQVLSILQYQPHSQETNRLGCFKSRGCQLSFGVVALVQTARDRPSESSPDLFVHKFDGI